MRIIVVMILLSVGAGLAGCSVPLWASAAEADRDAMKEFIDSLDIDEAVAEETKEKIDRMSEDGFRELEEATIRIIERDAMKEIIDSLDIDEAVAEETKEQIDRMSEDEFREFVEITLKLAEIGEDPNAWAVEQFNLWTRCAPVGLVIEPMTSDAEKIGLTAEDIQAAVESRLRSARIYTLEITDNYLYIAIHVREKMGNVFSINLELQKNLFDPVTELTLFAPTWSTGGMGTYRDQNASFILSSLSGFVDEFLVEYLRVNSRDCNS